MRTLITLHGKTDGSNTTGTMSLTGDMLYEPVSYIRIPKGLKAKVWCKRIAGSPCAVKIEMTRDVTVDSPSWSEIDVEVLASPGELDLEKRRPIVIRAVTGKEAFRVSWDQTIYPGSAGVTYADLEVEITDED